MASAPGGSSAASAPSGPSHIAFDDSSSAVMATTASTPSHAARGDGASVAPAATSGSARAARAVVNGHSVARGEQTGRHAGTHSPETQERDSAHARSIPRVAARLARWPLGGQSVERLDGVAGGENRARERGFAHAEALVQHGLEQRAQIRRRRAGRGLRADRVQRARASRRARGRRRRRRRRRTRSRPCRDPCRACR